MPVAKAKGAIFAIYADSPSASSSTLAKPTRAATTKTVSPTKCPSASVSASVSVTAAPRRALGTLQPSAPTGRRGFPSAKLHQGKEGKEGKVLQVKVDDKIIPKPTKTLRPTALSNTAPSAAATKITAAATATATSKRPHGLLSPTTPAAPSTPAKQLRDRERGQGSAKRVKSAGRKGEACEKENRPLSSDVLDSPAGRTRSKTGTGARAHRPAESISTLGEMALGSPNRPRAATTSALPGEPSERSRQEDVFGVRGLSGVVMKDVAGLRGEEKSSGKMRKGLGVRPDGPLVDVSEAYGATGEEPVGFRDAVLV